MPDEAPVTRTVSFGSGVGSAMPGAYPGRRQAIVAAAPHSVGSPLDGGDEPRPAGPPLVVGAERAARHARAHAEPGRAVGDRIHARTQDAAVVERAAQRGRDRDGAPTVRVRRDDLREEVARRREAVRLAEVEVLLGLPAPRP